MFLPARRPRTWAAGERGGNNAPGAGRGRGQTISSSRNAGGCLAKLASAVWAGLDQPPAGSPFTVELEKDLSAKRQLLDVVVIRRGPGQVTCPLPNGLDDFVDHNLITFKSHREPLDDWALKELTGHYVNYRKQVSARGSLVPEDRFRLYAVCARHPRDLFAAVPAEALGPGVYTCRRGSDAIRVVVAADLPKTERNALLHLFSAAPDQVQYGAEHYRLQPSETSTVVYKLFEQYRLEGLTMPYTMEQFRKEVASEILEELTPEELLGVLNKRTPQDRQRLLEARTIGERLRVVEELKSKERLRLLEELTPAERLRGLSLEQIEAYLHRLRKAPPAARKKRPKSKK